MSLKQLRGVRRWPVWSLPGRMIVLLVLVEVGAAALVVTGLVTGQFDMSVTIGLLLLSTLGVVHTELATGIERVRRRVAHSSYFDLSSVWTFAGAVLLPPAVGSLVVVVVYAHLWARVWRPAGAPLYRHVYTTATVMLACQAAGAIIDPTQLTDTAGYALLGLAMVVYVLVNQVLVALALGLTAWGSAAGGAGGVGSTQGSAAGGAGGVGSTQGSAAGGAGGVGSTQGSAAGGAGGVGSTQGSAAGGAGGVGSTQGSAAGDPESPGRRPALTDLVGDWDDHILEGATLCLGVLASLAVLRQPVLVVLVLPPLLVLHRAVLIRQLEERANTDAKTGLLTATAWRGRANRALQRAERNGSAVAVLVIDVDHFKAVNDTYGHLAGDEVLVAVAGTFLREVRDDDLVGRFGGEEFVVLLNGLPPGDAGRRQLHAAAERVRCTVHSLSVEVTNSDGPSRTISGRSVSIGGALSGVDGHDIDALVRVADRLLYAAKRAGRNQVCVGTGLGQFGT